MKLELEEAVAQIRAAVRPLPSEEVPAEAALGRVLAEDVRAAVTQPPFDRSHWTAMRSARRIRRNAPASAGAGDGLCRRLADVPIGARTGHPHYDRRARPRRL